MFVDDVVFERITEAPPEFEEYLLRVFLKGGEPEERATPFVVKVGEVRVEMLVTVFGEEGIEGLQGMLKQVPQFGDEVMVGYAGRPMRSTGFTFSLTQDV